MEFITKTGKNSMPLVSVITVSLNRARDLRRTMSSVLGQDYNNIQYIVIDGGSDDGSRELLEDNKDRLEFISEKDHGIYDAMNKGLRLVKGRWMIFLNSGDEFSESNSVRSFLTFAKDGVAFLYSDYYRPIGLETDRKPVCQSRSLLNRFGIVRMICHQTICFSVNHFPGPYDDSLRMCADMDVILRIYKRRIGLLKHIPLPLVTYQGGGTSEQDYRELHAERTRVIKRHFNPVIAFINQVNHTRIRFQREKKS